MEDHKQLLTLPFAHLMIPHPRCLTPIAFVEGTQLHGQLDEGGVKHLPPYFTSELAPASVEGGFIVVVVLGEVTSHRRQLPAIGFHELTNCWREQVQVLVRLIVLDRHQPRHLPSTPPRSTRAP